MSSPIRRAQKTHDREKLRNVAYMMWGAARNLALRQELGLVDGEVGMINQAGWLQVVVDAEERAHELSQRISRSFIRADVTIIRRKDRRHLIQADLARYAG